jgi:uroporphyrinogen decarboxylase
MTQKEVMTAVLDGKKPPYVPWALSFTLEAREKLVAHYGSEDLTTLTGSHLVESGEVDVPMRPIGNDCWRDVFGVVWDRSVDKDIGIVKEHPLPEPTLQGFSWPDPCHPDYFTGIPKRLAQYPDKFHAFRLGFSLFERAWTLRGTENLMVDFIENPGFVHELLGRITDYNVAHLRKALEYGIDAVYFGDDWGQQRGLQMGAAKWREFIKPQLKRMYDVVHAAGRWVFIHSCGDVDELFGDFIEIGVNCFNPFQPEVMDVYELLTSYRGRLAFHGGMSTQKTLPFGTVADVAAETRRLLAAGRDGGYIFSPAHAVEGDVPLENMLAFIEVLKGQPGLKGSPR